MIYLTKFQASYVKAIDVWMGACMTFVFLAMIEFTVVNFCVRRKPSNNNDTTAVFGYIHCFSSQVSTAVCPLHYILEYCCFFMIYSAKFRTLNASLATFDASVTNSFTFVEEFIHERICLLQLQEAAINHICSKILMSNTDEAAIRWNV